MIGKLKGRIDSFGTDWLIIDVSGVGYHVFCSSKTLAALPSVGEFAELHTEMLVSQDMIRLVGFASVLEREWFRLLQTVQGVGTRVARPFFPLYPLRKLPMPLPCRTSP